jgi:PAS domain S-box-containing protein
MAEHEVPLRILILEDTPSDVGLIERELKKANFNFISKIVVSRDQYLTSIRLFSPDVILSDHNLPQFNSVEALKIFKEEKLLIPFILVTGNVSEEFAVSILKQGASDYILKSNLTRLPVAIENALAMKQAEKKMEALHLENETLLKRLQLQLERMPIAFIMNDTDFKFTYWNPAAEKLFGYSNKEVVGKHAAELIVPEEEQTQVHDIFTRLESGDMEANTLGENITRDGQRVLLSWRNTPLFDESGKFLGAMSMAEDITEKKKAEDVLRQSEEKYRTLFETISEGVAYVDADDVIQFVNKQFCLMNGYVESELIGKNFADLFVTEESLEVFSENRKLQLHGASIEFDLPWKKKNDELIWVIVKGAPVSNSSGEVVGNITTLTDITGRKHSEEQILNALREKETLLREMHHRVKNNLAIVTGILQLQLSKLESDALQQPLRDSISRIHSIALIHEDLYKNKTLHHIDFAAYVKHLIDSLQSAFSGGETEIDIHLSVQAIQFDVDHCMPCGLIISELISNIYKHAFTERKNGNIYVRFYEQNEYYTLEVEDDGIGIADTHSLPDSKTLGMFLVYSLAEQLNAVVSIKSEKGAHFSFHFK